MDTSKRTTDGCDAHHRKATSLVGNRASANSIDFGYERDEARRIAANIAKLLELLRAAK